jgi:hypothetical protein
MGLEGEEASSLWCTGISWRLPPFSCRRTQSLTRNSLPIPVPAAIYFPSPMRCLSCGSCLGFCLQALKFLARTIRSAAGKTGEVIAKLVQI